MGKFADALERLADQIEEEDRRKVSSESKDNYTLAAYHARITEDGDVKFHPMFSKSVEGVGR